jgi:histidinol dehydrogenase
MNAQVNFRKLTKSALLSLARPEADPQAVETVIRVIADVRREGDAALRRYTKEFDKVELGLFRVDPALGPAIERAELAAIEAAAGRIRRFAEAQLSSFKDFEVELEKGVWTGQRVVPLRSVGAYGPGGRHPLVSSVLMCVIPAKVAGVRRGALCTPPQRDGKADPRILAAARFAGADEVYCLGGAQAIAALAYGTESIAPVDKIVGPGNRYVTCAKSLVMGEVGIDILAGPTEVLVVADDSANPAWVAADLAAQAEHAPDSQSILLCFSEGFADAVSAELDDILAKGRAGVDAVKSLQGDSGYLVVQSIEEAAALSDAKAPEHLEVMTRDSAADSRLFSCYGSLFIGPYAAEVFGDYSAGINHTLPTSRAARFTGGLSVKDFLAIRTTLRVEGRNEGLIEVAEALARMEGLVGHGNAATARRG